MTKAEDHDKWCREQHNIITKSIGKIYTRLGTMETHIEAHKDCAEQVRKELKTLNNWAQKRDGATTALMWVAGIAGTLLVIVIAFYKLSG